MDDDNVLNQYVFNRNMRRTPWERLFPHWWDTNDALLSAIGDEVERIKASALFSLLNAGMKPPVMIWKESIVHSSYSVKHTCTQLKNTISIQSPLYKTWGYIILKNNTKEDIYDLKVMINETDGIFIGHCKYNDIIKIDLIEQKIIINNESLPINNIGDGIPYFKNQQNKEQYNFNEKGALHNAAVRINILSDITPNIDAEVILKDAVFTNEQNIEITSIELMPIEKIEVFAYYDFPYNTSMNGWQKAYEKIYDEKTNVIYDMITTQLYTEKFYVEVSFKGVQYPYKVGFPCYREAPKDSMYHINERLDSWGELLGLPRRNYRTNIKEEDYPTTFPVYYPYDIEQDYWYYKRLISEYSWNHLAIDDVDLKDTEGNNVVRLYSINPFSEDFVVHAKSTYPTDKDVQDYNTYTPSIVSEQSSKGNAKQSPYKNIKNVLTYDDRETNVTLTSKTGTNINLLKYQSKDLYTFFDLSDLPEDINIDNIEILVEGSSTDNKTDKYSNDDTGLIIPHLYEDGITFIPLHADTSYQLSNQVITYSSNDLQKYLQELQDYSDEKIEHSVRIGAFQEDVGKSVSVPFRCFENGEEFTDITDVWIYFGDVMVNTEYESGTKKVKFTIPKTSNTKMTFIVKSYSHKPITATIDIGRSTKVQYAIGKDGQYETEEITVKDENGQIVLDDQGNEKKETVKKIVSTQEYIYGPLTKGVPRDVELSEEWHTKDVRNIIQRQGIYFRNVFENENEQSQTTLNIKNITLKVSYSDKKSDFTMTTDIKYNVLAPKIAEYSVTIKNIGDKPLDTIVDVITAPNIQMDKNYFKVHLQRHEEITETANVYAQTNNIDGYFDIVTVCEDKIQKDAVPIFTTGLLETGVRLFPHHTRYIDETTLTAEIINIDSGTINPESIEFYINNYLIPGTVEIQDNIATLKFTPQDYTFIDTGLQTLEVRFTGNSRYLPSRAVSDIFFRKEDTFIEIEADDYATYMGEYRIEATVHSKDRSGNIVPVTDGIVTFYANNILLGKTDLLGRMDSQEGIFPLTISPLDLDPGKYTLWVRYGDSDTYASDEASKEFRIFGGETIIQIFDIEASPIDEVLIRASIRDVLLDPVQIGNAIIDVYYEKNNQKVYLVRNEKKEIQNGYIEHSCNLSEFDFSDINNDTINAIIEVTFGDTESSDDKTGFSMHKEQGHLKISKKNVILESENIFNGTQSEPLGFLVKVIDAQTKQPVDTGKVSIQLRRPNRQIIGSSYVDNDGYARIVCNPMMSIQEWDTTGKFHFVLGSDYPILYKNEQPINILDEYRDLLDSNDIDIGNLYVIVDDDDIHEFFKMNEDGILTYCDAGIDCENIEEDEVNYFFINPNNKELYRQTTYQPQIYDIGNHTIHLIYDNSTEYKSKESIYENGLSITASEIDLELHTYALNYDDKHDIICYVDSHDDDGAILGSVQFYIDDKLFMNAPIESNQAVIPYSRLPEIKYGNHLIKAVYKLNDDDTAYTYATLELSKIAPMLEYTVNSLISGEESTVSITINNQSRKVISGFVNLYLDGELVDYQYLYGNEGYYGIINEHGHIENGQIPPSYTIDDIIDENFDNTILLKLSFIVPDDIDSTQHYIEVEYEGNDLIEGYKTDKYILRPTEIPTTLSIAQTYVARGQKNEIDVTVQSEDDHTINQGHIQILKDTEIVAQASVYNNKTTITWTPDTDETIQYYIKYSGGGSFQPTMESIQDANITLINPEPYIYVSNYITDDVPVTYTSLRDAIQCLQPNGTIEISEEYNINKITIDKPLTIRGEYEAIINLKDDLIIANNVTFDNITIQSDNNKSIINRGKLKIIHSILKNDISISSNNELIINRSLVYCTINANRYDLDNNWWGTNNAPYTVNNNIILSLSTSETPAVICDNIDIIGKMIGANGNEYDIPEATFTLSADTGYFSIDNGKMINHTVNSSYFDATEEGKVYLTVDNETIDTDIYSYDKKTEVILEPITDIPTGYYVTFNAYVYSVTDSYKEFSDIHGYVNFYFDNTYIGKGEVHNNKAQVSMYIKDGLEQYSTEEPHTLKAQYVPSEKYFSSSQELTFNIINTNKIYYVSSENGKDIFNGNYDTPFATISKAIEVSDAKAENNITIFLIGQHYTENNINIDKNVTIQSYSHNATFKGIEDTIFNISANGSLRLSKINFVNNQADYLISNQGPLYMEQCLLQDNPNIADNPEHYTIEIEYSAIINQNIINGQHYNKCWFGENEGLGRNNVQMETSSSKDKIYQGVIALIKGSIMKYEDDSTGELHTLDKTIPLRIAEFYSGEASLEPLEDYTYYGFATSILNTNIESNSNEYTIELEDREFYENDNVYIKHHIYHTLTKDKPTGVANVVIQDTQILYDEQVPIIDGIAGLPIQPLSIGKYHVICTYDSDAGSTSVENTIIVKKHDIKVDEFNIENESAYTHALSFNAQFSATDEQPINNEIIDIYLDGNKIAEATIRHNADSGKNIISTMIKYDPLDAKTHIIRLANRDGKYNAFEYEHIFNTQKVDTIIHFDYDKVQKGVENAFMVTVTEESDIYNVQDGELTILFDDNIVVQDESFYNGQYTFNLNIAKQGQYSVFIHYHDTSNRYNDCTQSFLVNVDIFPIAIENLPNTFNTNIGKSISIKNNIIDASKHPVNKGYFNIYIDDILIDKEINITVSQLVYQLQLPNYISTGDHILKFEYIDTTDTYLDTDIYRTLTVNKIPTSIQVSNYELYPNQEGHIPFNILSDYGIVNSGVFSITMENEYGETKTYSKALSDNIIRQIDFTVPNLPAGQYPITATYHDDNNIYKDCTLETTITIDKNEVIIVPNYRAYYPQKEFIFTADIFNQENKRIDTGYVDIYIDNVKEKEHINVKNGQISTRMFFNTARVYKVKMIYDDEDGYYEKTASDEYDLVINRMDINDIQANFNEETKVIESVTFNTIDDYDITDGILYMFVDASTNVYNMNEIHKYIDLDVSYLTKGDHKITFNYNGSSVFTDYSSSTPQIIRIPPLETIMHFDVTNKTTESRNEINISGDINTEGTIRFYIRREEMDYKFIGLTNASNDRFNFKYQLSPNIQAGEYQIKAVFDGNDYYDTAIIDDLILTVVRKTEPIQIINMPDTVEYQGILKFDVLTEIPDALVHVGLKKYNSNHDTTVVDDEENVLIPLNMSFDINVNKEPNNIIYIDTIVVNGEEPVEYELDDDLIGKYYVIIEYEGSPVYAPTYDKTTFDIIPYTPLIDNTTINVGIGGNPLLSNKVYHGTHIIHTGQIKYLIQKDDTALIPIETDEDNVNVTMEMSSEYTCTYSPNIEQLLNYAVMENTEIPVQYISADTNKILDSEVTTIPITVSKNDIDINIIEAPKYIDYLEPFDVKVKLSSNSSLPINVNVTANYQYDDATEENDIITIPCKVNTESDEYDIIITASENEFFNAAVTQYTAKLNEKDYVKVVDTSMVNTEVTTLADAIMLVKDNGTIEINKTINNEGILTIDENITIIGKGNTMQGTQIINENNLTIEDIAFDNSSITNNGTIDIHDCTFMHTNGNIISNSNSMTIENCIFEDNNVGSDSCIKIVKPNVHTVIDKCTFNHNSGSGDAICIVSKRVNELEISNTKFINNNQNNSESACIYAYGNSAFYKNIFYNNNVAYEIRAIKSNIIADKNIFDGTNLPISFEMDSVGDIDLNYWGGATTRENINIPESIEINNWLIGSLDREENSTIVQPNITQYVNMLETEITDINIQYDSFDCKYNDT